MKKEISCGAIVYRDDLKQRRFLVIHQVQGHWTFPKGHMEQGEDEFMTAKREVFEETNVKIQLLPGFRRSHHYLVIPSVWKKVIFFVAKALNGDLKPQLEEVCEVYWLTQEEVENILTYPSDSTIFQEVIDFLIQKEKE